MFNNNNGTGNSLINDISAVAHDASAATIINLEKIQEISAAANSLSAWGRGQYKRAIINDPGPVGGVLPLPSAVQALSDGILVRVTMQAGGGAGASSATDPDSSNIMGGGGGMGGTGIRYFQTTPFGNWNNGADPSWNFFNYGNAAVTENDIRDSSTNAPYDGTHPTTGNGARAGLRAGFGWNASPFATPWLPYPWYGAWPAVPQSSGGGAATPYDGPAYEMIRARLVHASPGGHGTRPQSEGGVAPGGHGGVGAFGFSGYGSGGQGGDGTALGNAGLDGQRAIVIFEWFE